MNNPPFYIAGAYEASGVLFFAPQHCHSEPGFLGEESAFYGFVGQVAQLPDFALNMHTVVR